MNGTFMFGHDCLGVDEDFFPTYRELSGSGLLGRDTVNRCIRETIDRLYLKYTDSRFTDNFPSVASELGRITELQGQQAEIKRMAATIARHELGHVPDEYQRVIRELGKHYRLAAVVDIWSPSLLWREVFAASRLADVFSALWFSSDHGVVKPSRIPFHWALDQLKLLPDDVLMIGDSIRRDLGGARKAGIDCVLVGGNAHEDAIAEFSNLLEFADAIL